MLSYPDQDVPRVSHDSVEIPVVVRNQYLLDDADLAVEIRRITNHLTPGL